MTEGRRYERTGVLAVNPGAFTMIFAGDPVQEPSEIDGVPVVSINGPLEHHAGMWCDNYDAITQRVAKALEGPAPGVVLRVDSPGGLVSGCMETARALRAMADVAKKRLVVYVDGQATSAAYALACVADHVVLPATGTVGSIGVISAMMDATAANEAAGLRVAMVTSGARKADGNPDVPLTADALAATQDVVDTLAALLFEHVAAHRPALTVDAIRDLQAGLVIGARAVALGLADAVGSINDALALARGEQAAPPQESETTMATSMEDAIAALRAAAEGDDEEMAARAARALKAMDGEDEPDGDEPKPDAEDAPEPEPKKDDEDDSSAKALATKALATAERAERMQLLATRPDISPKLRASLENAPTATIRAVLDATPRVSVKPPTEVKATRGEGQGAESGTSRLPATEKSALDARMGLASTERKVVYTGNKLILGATVPTTKGA